MIIIDTNVISELMKTQKSAIVREWVAAQPLMKISDSDKIVYNTHIYTHNLPQYHAN